jgi:hypothetical protein
MDSFFLLLYYNVGIFGDFTLINPKKVVKIVQKDTLLYSLREYNEGITQANKDGFRDGVVITLLIAILTWIISMGCMVAVIWH